MGKKQLVSFSLQHTCTSVGGSYKDLAQNNVMGLDLAPCSLDLSSPNFFLFPHLKVVPKGQ
jgi:hypothetical protein